MRLLPILTAVVVGLTLVATASARTAATWGSQAHKVCAQIDKEIDRIPEPTSLSGLAVQLPKLLAAGRKEHRLLKAIAVPAAQKTKVSTYLATYPRLFALLEKMIDAAKAGDQKGFDGLLAKGEPISMEATRLASALKAPACAD